MTKINITGKVAIVTGAGHGAGAAVARALAAAGARVAVNDINPDRAHRVAVEIREGGGAAIDVMADISNRFQCVNLIETTRAEWERLDIVVNCASIAPTASILKMDEWEWARCLDVNLKSVFMMSQLAGRVMADQVQSGGELGLIVNLVAAEPEGDGRAAFIASQAAVAAFGRACAREFAPLGIHVVTLPATGLLEEIAATVMEIATNYELRIKN
jgi:NAD(P)-dependent dehydrogenase (short-subunit alcohol dehydrogenase family)